jgi:hypothetical protein
MLSSRRNSRVPKRRAAVGALLVLHTLWLAMGAMPNAMAGDYGQVASSASAVAVRGRDVPPCHGETALSESGTLAPLHDGPSKHSHAPCCATQCHCPSGLCAALMPAVMTESVTFGYEQSADFTLSRPPLAPIEFDLRPPIAI